MAVNYLDDINFIYCNLKYAQFHPDLTNVLFDYAQLDGAIFYGRLERVSFDHVDLQKTSFIPIEPVTFLHVTLDKTKLATEIFYSLLNVGLKDFIGTQLQEVDFQPLQSHKKLKINFSYANLENVDLSHLDLYTCQFFNVNLRGANLQGALLRSKNINEFVDVEGAKFTVQTLGTLYKGGVKSFKDCSILWSYVFIE